MAELKSEDRQHKRNLDIDPVKLLERLGIDDYSLDYANKRVTGLGDKLEYFGKRVGCYVAPNATAIPFAGWWWEK